MFFKPLLFLDTNVSITAITPSTFFVFLVKKSNKMKMLKHIKLNGIL
jgi:hypothetical protein